MQDEIIKLLKLNKKLILTGAPGTDGDLMVVYKDSYGTDYPLDRANKRISAGYGHYFKKVK